MQNYRINLDEPRGDPLAIDPELAVRHAARQALFRHSVVAFLTLGLWLPVLAFMFLRRDARAREAVQGYSVRIADGQLFAGTRERHALVPLDRIRSASTVDGLLQVTFDGAAPLAIVGLADPLAAAQAILAARDAKLVARTSGAFASDDDVVARAPDVSPSRRSP